MASRLETALDEFLRTHLGAERIDDLPLTPAQRAAKKADYFAAQREVVIELKLLTDARVSAVRRVVDEFRRAPDGSARRGERDLAEVERVREDAFRRRVFDAASRSVSRCARSANQQIRATARNFALARPLGVLLLLNERGGVLEPGVLATAAEHVLAQRRADGTREFAQLDVIVVATESAALHTDETLLWIRADDSVHHARAASFEHDFRAVWMSAHSNRSASVAGGAPRGSSAQRLPGAQP